jgi:CheY-like chemotaxis protein
LAPLTDDPEVIQRENQLRAGTDCGGSVFWKNALCRIALLRKRKRAMSTQVVTRSLRILVVENHPDTLESLKWYLEDLGHHVFTSMTLREAGSLLRNCDCEMVICDIGLPDGTGWDLMDEIHKSPRPIFAVAMSGFGMNADSARSRAVGFRDHLFKPFKAAELDRVIAEAGKELA